MKEHLAQHPPRKRFRLPQTHSFRALAAILLLGFSTAHAAEFTVTNLNDSGSGSLRQAILDANKQSGKHIIHFKASLSGILRIANALVISRDITINGPGKEVLTIDGNLKTIFHIDKPTAIATISGLTITNGGMAIMNRGKLTIEKCDISHNNQEGIYNYHDINAKLVVNDSILSKNQKQGIRNNGGDVTLNRVELSDNDSSGAYNYKGPMSVDHGTISNNRGGGIVNNDGNLTVKNSSIDSNQSTSWGAGIYSYSEQLTIANTTFSNNISSGCGGGIYIGKSTSANVYNNTLSGNEASQGGGLCINHGASLAPFNLTLSGNRASNTGGGIHIYRGSTLLMGNSLVVGNRTTTGGNTGIEIYNSNGTFSSRGYNLFGQNGISGLTNATQATTDKILAGAVKTAIHPLADNDGPTKTHLLVAGSPAINAGDNSLIPKDVTTDQRDKKRIENARVDIGAVEVPAAPSTYKFSVTSIVGKGTVTSAPSGINCGATCNASFKSGTTVKLTAIPAAGYTFGGWSGACKGTAAGCQVTMNAAKTVTATFIIKPRNAPDFLVTGIVLTPASPAANSTFTAKVTVKNQGKAAADGGYLDVWAHQPTAQTCYAQGEWAEIGSLKAGESKTLTLNLRSKGPGTKTLRTFIDSWCETAEANEANNQSVKAYTVK